MTEPIFSYTRAQAIADGVLIDLTAWAKETGFTVPVAITAAAWAAFIEWPESNPLGISIRGRAHDVLFMLWAMIKQSKPGAARIDFTVSRIPLSTRTHAVAGNLYALSGPGDNGEQVITIMLPEED